MYLTKFNKCKTALFFVIFLSFITPQPAQAHNFFQKLWRTFYYNIHTIKRSVRDNPSYAKLAGASLGTILIGFLCKRALTFLFIKKTKPSKNDINKEDKESDNESKEEEEDNISNHEKSFEQIDHKNEIFGKSIINDQSTSIKTEKDESVIKNSQIDPIQTELHQTSSHTNTTQKIESPTKINERGQQKSSERLADEEFINQLIKEITDIENQTELNAANILKKLDDYKFDNINHTISSEDEEKIDNALQQRKEFFEQEVTVTKLNGNEENSPKKNRSVESRVKVKRLSASKIFEEDFTSQQAQIFSKYKITLTTKKDHEYFTTAQKIFQSFLELFPSKKKYSDLLSFYQNFLGVNNKKKIKLTPSSLPNRIIHCANLFINFNKNNINNSAIKKWRENYQKMTLSIKKTTT